METTNVKPYGAWIDPNGDLIIVQETMCHMEYALAILNLPDDSKRKYPIYQIMYRLGYIRMTNKIDMGYTLEIKHGQKIRKNQLMYIECADFVGPCDYPKLF